MGKVDFPENACIFRERRMRSLALREPPLHRRRGAICRGGPHPSRLRRATFPTGGRLLEYRRSSLVFPLGKGSSARKNVQWRVFSGSSARKNVQWTFFSENGPAGPRRTGRKAPVERAGRPRRRAAPDEVSPLERRTSAAIGDHAQR